jgi:membrane associated rhomboid family serine protease
MKKHKKNIPSEPKFLKAAFPLITFIGIIWIVKIAEIIFQLNFVSLGIYPRHLWGAIGIITSPLIHGDFNHLISNSLPLLIMGVSLFYFYPKSAPKVFPLLYILTGLFVWSFARESFHIGASGIVYGLASFFFFSGVFKRDKRAISLALIVTFLYGGLVWGILPVKEGMSWESHLFGAVWGIILAIIFRKSDPYKRYDWEDEDNDTPPDKLEISYDKDPF